MLPTFNPGGLPFRYVTYYNSTHHEGPALVDCSLVVLATTPSNPAQSGSASRAKLIQAPIGRLLVKLVRQALCLFEAAGTQIGRRIKHL